jgi:hypothetical protein
MGTFPKTERIISNVDLPVLDIQVGDSQREINESISRSLEFPLKLSAAITPDSKLYITKQFTIMADGSAKTISPISKLIPDFPDSTVDFQTQATTGGLFEIDFPSSTVGSFRRCVFSINGEGKIQGEFTNESATLIDLENAGFYFVDGHYPIGWVDLECTNAAGFYKTAGSLTDVIENSVGGVPRIFRIFGGGGGGSGDISQTSGGGFEIKARAYCFSDGSSVEFNCNPPTVVGGKTQLLLNFDIKASDFVEIYVDQKAVPKFISNDVTPGPYWKIRNPQSGDNSDLTFPSKQIEVLCFQSVEDALSVPMLLAGLDIKNKSFCFSDGSGMSSGIAGIDSSGGKTVVTTDYGITFGDVVFVQVDGIYIPQFIDGVTPGPYWRSIDSNNIEFDADISVSPKQIVILVFRGSSFVDSYGNINLILAPTVSNLVLQSPDFNKWFLGTTNLGELVPATIAEGNVDPLRIHRDIDNQIVSIEIDNEGALAVNDSPTPGVLVDKLFVRSPNGLVWQIFVSQDNEIYVQDGYGNRFTIKNDIDEILEQVNETVGGATHYYKNFPTVADLPIPPTTILGTVPTAWAFDPATERHNLYVFSQGEWKAFPLIEQLREMTNPIGSYIHADLTEAQLQAQMGNGWILADGRNVYGSLYHSITGKAVVPDCRGIFLRGKNNGRSDGFENRGNGDFGSLQDNGAGGELDLGQIQNHAVINHDHNLHTLQDDGTYFTGIPYNGNIGFFRDNGYRYTWQSVSESGSTGVGKVATTRMSDNHFDVSMGETRPTNITTNIFIRIN